MIDSKLERFKKGKMNPEIGMVPLPSQLLTVPTNSPNATITSDKIGKGYVINDVSKQNNTKSTMRSEEQKVKRLMNKLRNQYLEEMEKELGLAIE